MKLTERSIQNLLYRRSYYDKQHEMIVPNSCVFGWEADLISVTKTDFIHEFEIKISRSDFKADAKKEEKHTKVITGQFNCRWRGLVAAPRPNFFWYVVPEGLITLEEVPSYAGLLVVVNDKYLSERKAAPRLHKDRITEKQRRQLHRATMCRFWDQRIKADNSVKKISVE